MSLNVSAITGYVAENDKVLIGRAIIGSKTARLLNLQTGVKGSSYLNILNANPTLQAGTCGWNEDGVNTLTRRTINTGLVKVNVSFCDKDLVDTSMQHGVKIAAGYKTLPFEEEFIGQNVAAVQKKLEEMIWKGDTASGTGYLKLMDGFIKLFEESGVVSAGTGVALTTPVEAIKAVVAAMPNEIMDRNDKVIFVGYDVYRAYVAALQELNLFHYTAELGGDMEVVIPGTDIRLIGVGGLTGTGKIYGSYLENMFLGTDLQGDSEKFEFWYSQDNSEFRLKIEFNAGVQVAFPDLVVKYVGA